FAEHTLRRFKNREVDVSADVENANLERSMPVGLTEKGNDLLFFARIRERAWIFSTHRFDFFHQRFKLGTVPPASLLKRISSLSPCRYNLRRRSLPRSLFS